MDQQASGADGGGRTLFSISGWAGRRHRSLSSFGIVSRFSLE
jgi:hypothetical protein